MGGMSTRHVFEDEDEEEDDDIDSNGDGRPGQAIS